MDEQQPAAETELTTISNTDEVAEGPSSRPANDNPESERDEQPLKESGNSICETHHHHHKWLWLHAAFHCLVTIVVSKLNVVVPTPTYIFIPMYPHSHFYVLSFLREQVFLDSHTPHPG